MRVGTGVFQPGSLPIAAVLLALVAGAAGLAPCDWARERRSSSSLQAFRPTTQPKPPLLISPMTSILQNANGEMPRQWNPIPFQPQPTPRVDLSDAPAGRRAATGE
ncbi:hypothetical protein H8959_018028 [Pygathrix nigripes]